MKRETLITKTSGAVVPFSEDKLRTAPQRGYSSTSPHEDELQS